MAFAAERETAAWSRKTLRDAVCMEKVMKCVRVKLQSSVDTVAEWHEEYLQHANGFTVCGSHK